VLCAFLVQDVALAQEGTGKNTSASFNEKDGKVVVRDEKSLAPKKGAEEIDPMFDDFRTYGYAASELINYYNAGGKGRSITDMASPRSSRRGLVSGYFYLNGSLIDSGTEIGIDYVAWDSVTVECIGCSYRQYGYHEIKLWLSGAVLATQETEVYGSW
jgi:hypothetical protein